MQFHRSTVAALAAACFLSLFAADNSGALADNGIGQSSLPAVVTEETVPSDAQPEPIEFTAQPVIQPTTSETPSAAPNARSLSALIASMPRDAALSRELECLAGAIYFEARGEPIEGQLAVGQVVINRSESGRYPADYCGVVYQPAQFSFVRGGRMPSIDRSSGAWHRASAIARIAHQGLWDSQAADSLYFHARYVKPSWSRTKIARATIDSHIFYR